MAVFVLVRTVTVGAAAAVLVSWLIRCWLECGGHAAARRLLPQQQQLAMLANAVVPVPRYLPVLTLRCLILDVIVLLLRAVRWATVPRAVVGRVAALTGFGLFGLWFG
jgi:hypothetical protein